MKKTVWLTVFFTVNATNEQVSATVETTCRGNAPHLAYKLLAKYRPGLRWEDLTYQRMDYVDGPYAGREVPTREIFAEPEGEPMQEDSTAFVDRVEQWVSNLWQK